MEELSLITKLDLTGISSLKDIDKLPKLKELNIYSYSSSNLNTLSESNLNFTTDFTPIENLSELEVLRIYNDNFIKHLNLNNLKKLRVLILYNNNKLETVDGIDSLKRLEEVCLCNNNIKTLPNIKEFINNTRDTAINILDINLFVNLFGKCEENRKFLEDRLNKAMSNICFGEKVSFDDGIFIIYYNQAKSMYHRALRILKNLQIKSNIDLEDICKIHSYIAFSLKYDQVGLEYRSNIYQEMNYKPELKNSYIMKRLKLMNSSYAALVNHEAICEGYVNMMIFLLNIIGIESKGVNCSLNTSEFNHAAIKFKFDNRWLYADPERERLTKEIDIFAIPFDEFKNSYFLPIKEYIDNDEIKEKELK